MICSEDANLQEIPVVKKKLGKQWKHKKQIYIDKQN